MNLTFECVRERGWDDTQNKCVQNVENRNEIREHSSKNLIINSSTDCIIFHFKIILILWQHFLNLRYKVIIHLTSFPIHIPDVVKMNLVRWTKREGDKHRETNVKRTQFVWHIVVNKKRSTKKHVNSQLKDQHTECWGFDLIVYWNCWSKSNIKKKSFKSRRQTRIQWKKRWK